MVTPLPETKQQRQNLANQTFPTETKQNWQTLSDSPQHRTTQYTTDPRNLSIRNRCWHTWPQQHLAHHEMPLGKQRTGNIADTLLAAIKPNTWKHLYYCWVFLTNNSNELLCCSSTIFLTKNSSAPELGPFSDQTQAVSSSILAISGGVQNVSLINLRRNI